MTTDLRLHEAAAGRRRRPASSGSLAAGLPIDAQDADGRTPVMVATVARRTDAVRALVDAGADVDLRDNRLDNVFLYAGAEGLLDILRIANEAGADPALTNRFGGIALIPASERGHVEVVRYLLDESDVDVDHVNRLGWTALLEAIILSDGGPAHQEIVRHAARGGRRPGPRRRRGRHAARPRPLPWLRRDRGAALAAARRGRVAGRSPTPSARGWRGSRASSCGRRPRP